MSTDTELSLPRTGGARGWYRANPVLLPLQVMAWQLVLWAGAAAFLYRSMQMDSAEQFAWSVSLENGYWKHPPLPSWIMHGLVALFGPSVALPVVATQVAMVASLLLLYRLGSAVIGAERAAVAIVLTSLVTYFNQSADVFNHSTILMPFLCAMLLAFHSAFRRGGAQRWLLAGAFAGLAFMVKYLALLHIAAIGLYALRQARYRPAEIARGMGLAAAAGLLVAAPHLLWLPAHDFLPFKYARAVTLASPSWLAFLANLQSFLSIQFLRVAPMLLAAWWVFRKSGAARERAPAVAPEDVSYLWIAGFAPLAFEVAVAVASRTELQSRWGTTAFLTAGLLLCAHWRVQPGPAIVRRALWAGVAMQAVLCGAAVLSQTVLAEHFRWESRLNFPGDVLARRALDTWASHTKAPLHLVVSDIWLGGNLIAHSRGSISVLIDGQRYKSPWVKPGAVDRCGALVMQELPSDGRPEVPAHAAIAQLLARASATGVWELPWDDESAGEARPRGRVRWGVILPAPGSTCAGAAS